MIQLKNVLFATDFSDYSLSAANYAIDIAEQYNAKLHLLHVLEKIPPILAIRTLDLSQEKIVSSMEEEANFSLSKIANDFKNKTSKEVVTILKKGIDYQEIVDYSKEAGIDLIVIATHGRTGILHTLIGSVAEKVIRYAQCPVLVITPKGNE